MSLHKVQSQYLEVMLLITWYSCSALQLTFENVQRINKVSRALLTNERELVEFSLMHCLKRGPIECSHQG